MAKIPRQYLLKFDKYVGRWIIWGSAVGFVTMIFLGKLTANEIQVTWSAAIGLIVALSSLSFSYSRELIDEDKKILLSCGRDFMHSVLLMIGALLAYKLSIGSGSENPNTNIIEPGATFKSIVLWCAVSFFYIFKYINAAVSFALSSFAINIISSAFNRLSWFLWEKYITSHSMPMETQENRHQI